MLVAMVIVLFASQALCVEATRGLRLSRDEPPVIDDFAWNLLTEITGVDAGDHLEKPGEGGPESLACTKKPGPDRLDCPAAISAWTELTDDARNIAIEGGRCRSATKGTCRATACAPGQDISVGLDEVMGRMWNPVSMRCVLGGTGGIWQNEGSTLVIELGRP
ncbi:hypothetical protein NCS57_01155800 [Fusarium keratoplasticum]|uniref:Uncharacterized protein n=1 Tax=Fusarium keratoplasticum TaxID=1328300 RepID=A0ACC0QME7_9HYPO|nr:hypothetical protein NCS57_01155800 [Fusarium keratoplasticum]KAI8657766.1 hypothetical protein NCS57_01155800 [Fusarium keratoplasticum]